MKIRNFVALLMLVTASITYSTSAQTTPAAREKQKTEDTEKKPRTIDVSGIPLREGIHVVYTDEKSGLVVSRIVKHGKVTGYSAVDKKGKQVLPQGPPCPTCPVPCDPPICVGSGHLMACFYPIAPCRG